MKLINILITLVVSGGLASVQAQHHLPATSNANINGGINSPTTSGNVDIEGVATITDKADDTTRKLHDILTSVKGIMEEEFGLATTVGDGSGRRLSKSHKSDKGIDIINDILLGLVVIVLLLVDFLGLGGYDSSMLYGLLGAGTGEEEDTADEITAAHHGHDGSSSKTAKSGGTDGSAKASKESKSVSCINSHSNTSVRINPGHSRCNSSADIESCIISLPYFDLSILLPLDVR